MPGLLRGMARTAVVAGTATAVSNRVSRRQAQRWGYMDEQPQQQAPPQQYAGAQPNRQASQSFPEPGQVHQLGQAAGAHRGSRFSLLP